MLDDRVGRMHQSHCLSTIEDNFERHTEWMYVYESDAHCWMAVNEALITHIHTMFEAEQISYFTIRTFAETHLK